MHRLNLIMLSAVLAHKADLTQLLILDLYALTRTFLIFKFAHLINKNVERFVLLIKFAWIYFEIESNVRFNCYLRSENMKPWITMVTNC